MLSRAADLIGSYHDFASALLADGVLSDPWVAGKPRFRMAPVLLTKCRAEALYRAAEAMVSLHDEAVALCTAHPELLGAFFDWPGEPPLHVGRRPRPLARRGSRGRVLHA